MDTKTTVINAVLLTRLTGSPHLQCQFKAIPDLERSMSTDMSANTSDHPANKAVKKAIMGKGLGKKRVQCFKLMLASNAASSFVLFHATQSLEPLK